MTATAALMALPGLVAALNDVPYVFDVSDQSPLFKYTPDPNSTASIPDPSRGWAVSYTGSTGPWKSNSQGVGTSAHTTSQTNAQIEFLFVGTGVTFFGTMDPGALLLAVDGITARGTPESGTLFSTSGLNLGTHTALITRNPENPNSTPASITGARVTTTISSEATSFERVRYADMATIQDGNINPDLSGWNVVENGNLCSRSSGNVLQISVPSNAAFLELWVPSGFEGGPFSVAVDPAPPNGPVSVILRSSFNFWETSPEIAYFANLDPAVKYTAQITNRGAKLLCLQKAKVYFSDGESTPPTQSGSSSTLGPNASGPATNAAGSSTGTANGSSGIEASGGDSGSSTNSASRGKKSQAGAIAGGVIGGLAVLAAIVSLIFFLRRRKRNTRSRQQAMYKATSKTRDRPGSWQPFFGTGTMDSQGSRASKEFELIPPAFGGDKSSRHTSMQTYDSTTASTPMTPPVGEFGARILPPDEVSKFMPAPYNHFAGSHTSIPSQSSLPPISELPRAIPRGHSFAPANTMFAAASTGTAVSTARSALTSASSDTVDSLPPGWPSPPTSPPRPGPRPPPRKHMSRGSLSPPTSPTQHPVQTMPSFGSPGHLFDN
ncbi:hypothetical protein CspHIS471_0500430 [Cutaneotrichosporon sp. HIS471]|nr:hypothetical protein CspHIS471_0500430 [Cutaneotrichosporon sp. HIS471]